MRRAHWLLLGVLTAKCGFAQFPAALTCGTPVEASVAPPAFTYLTFTAQAGVSVLIRLSSTTRLPDGTIDRSFAPVVTLTDPQGRLVNARIPRFAAGANLAGEFDLPADGNYRIQVQSPNSKEGTFRVVYIPLNRPCSGGPLSCGQPVLDRITAPMQVKSFQFQAQAGDQLSVRLARFANAGFPNAQGYTPTLFAYTAVGQLAVDASQVPVVLPLSGGAVLRADFAAAAAGPITLIVLDAGNVTGNFAVTIVKLNGTCGGGGTLSCGQVRQGSIDQTIEVDGYSVAVSASEVFTLRVAKVDPASTLVPVLEVYDPDGKRIAPTALGSSSSSGIITATYTAGPPGVYSVLAQDTSIGTGAYALVFGRVNRPCNPTSLSCGSVVDGTIAGLLAGGEYTLDANAGDIYLLRLLRGGSNQQFRPRVDIYDPQGKPLQFLNTNDLGRLSFSLPTTGRYTLLVTDSFDGTQAGAYSLSLTRLNGPCNAGTLACGAFNAGNVARALDTSVYQYSAAAGESFSVRMSDPAGTLQPLIEIYDSLGNLTGQSMNGLFTQTDVVKPAAGVYTIVAGSGSKTPQTGPFSIGLVRTRNACGAPSAPQGQTLAGVVSGTAPFAAYTVPLQAGDSLLVRTSSSTAGFAAQMELYDPEGARLDANSFSLARRAAVSGDYTVLVGPSTARAAGAYAFSWQALNRPAGVTALACGGSATASLNGSNQFRYYAFPASTGDLMRLIFTRLSDNFAPQIELYTPAGTRLAATSDISQKAAADGMYLALLSPSTTDTETGSFTLAYQRANNPCSPLKLACGQTALRQASIPGQLDTFTFPGAGGDLTSIRLTQRSGAYAPFVELYDAAGNRMSSTSSGLMRPVLPADGNYTLLVRDRAGVNVGSYRVNVQDDTNACAVDDTEAPAVALLRPTGGEVLAGGSAIRIQWQSDDNVGVASQDITLSTDGGKNFGSTIVSGLSGNAQAFDWPLPPDVAPSRSAVIRITARDTAGNTRSATSDLLSLVGSGFTPNSSVTFAYDKLNRLTEAVLGDGRTIQYTWDAAGNLIQITIGGQ